MRKKGYLEIQFNWIFVLVAGALILTFFSVFIFKQKDISERSTDSLTVKNLGSILGSTGVSPGTTNLVTMPRKDLEFDCAGYGVGSTKQQNLNRIIFAPSIIKGKKLVTYTLEWKMPFRVVNFLYMTSPEARYIFISDNDLQLKAINNSLPASTMTVDGSIKAVMTKEFVDNLGDIKEEGNYLARIVDFKGVIVEGGLLPAGVKGAEMVSALAVTGQNEVEFFRAADGRWVSEGTAGYSGKELLLGAIFMDNKEDYACMLKKALKRHHLLTKVHKDRAAMLLTHYSGTGCASYFSIANMFERMEGITAAEPDALKMEELENAAQQLRSQNTLASEASCAPIY